MTRTNAALEIPPEDFAAANERLARIGLAPAVETRDEQLAADIAAAVSEAERPALAEQCAGTPTDQKAQLEAHPEPEQNGRQKQTRLSVKQLRERYQERILEQAAIESGAEEQIDNLQSIIATAKLRREFWTDALAEIDRD